MITDIERYEKVYEYREKFIDFSETDLEAQVKTLTCLLHKRAFFATLTDAGREIKSDIIAMYAIRELASDDKALAQSAAIFLLSCCGSKGENALDCIIKIFNLPHKKTILGIQSCLQKKNDIARSQGMIGKTYDGLRFYRLETKGNELVKIWLEFPYDSGLIKAYKTQSDEDGGINILLNEQCLDIKSDDYFSNDSLTIKPRNISIQEKDEEEEKRWIEKIKNFAMLCP